MSLPFDRLKTFSRAVAVRWYTFACELRYPARVLERSGRWSSPSSDRMISLALNSVTYLIDREGTATARAVGRCRQRASGPPQADPWGGSWAVQDGTATAQAVGRCRQRASGPPE